MKLLTRCASMLATYAISYRAHHSLMCLKSDGVAGVPYTAHVNEVFSLVVACTAVAGVLLHDALAGVP